MNVWEKLAYPFPPECIHWRVGSTTKDKSRGLALAYIDARDVMDRLDEVVGPGFWSDAYEETGKGRILCKLVISVPNPEGTGRIAVSKSDAAGDTDVEGEKGAVSDAFKRAAVKFGVGRYLYRLPAVWVPLKDGRYIEKKDEPKLPPWAIPGGPPPPDSRSGFVEDEQRVPVNPNASRYESSDDSRNDGDAEGVVVDFQKARDAKEVADVVTAFGKLQDEGIKKLGLEEYTKRVNVIMDQYGGVNIKDEGVDLDVARAIYKDIQRAIQQGVDDGAVS